MSKRKKALIMKAWKEWHNIYPVPSAVSFADPICFGKELDGSMNFWFDTIDKSTRMVRESNGKHSLHH